MKQLFIYIALSFSILFSSCKKEDEPAWRYIRFAFAEELSDSLQVGMLKDFSDSIIFVNTIYVDKYDYLSVRYGYRVRTMPIWTYVADFVNEMNMNLDKCIPGPDTDKPSSPYYTSAYYTSAYYFASSINGRVTITSDISLYGETPGEDISDHFYMQEAGTIADYEMEHLYMVESENDFSRYSIVYPGGTKKPTCISDLFYENCTLFKLLGAYAGMTFGFKDKPQNDVSTAIITIRIPVRETLYLDAIDDESGKLIESKVKHRERILSGSINMASPANPWGCKQ